MKCEVVVTGRFDYVVVVDADSEEEARRKAIEEFDDYDSTYLYHEVDDATCVRIKPSIEVK